MNKKNVVFIVLIFSVLSVFSQKVFKMEDEHEQKSYIKTGKDNLQNDYKNGQQAALEKMLHVIRKMQNPNCNEVLLHTHQGSYTQR